LIDNDGVFQGLLLKYLNYENFTYANSGINSNDYIGNLEHIQNTILDIINLYLKKKYDSSPKIRPAIIFVRNLITRLDSRQKFDFLASKALDLLGTVVKNPSFSSLFGSSSALSILLKNVIIPNITLSKVDEILFTNEPIEYIKLDLEEIDNETRRRSATDLALSIFTAFQKEWSELFLLYIRENFDIYNSDPVNNWKNKNTAIILLTSIATTNQAASFSVANSNEFIDIVNIFSIHILPDLQSEPQVHPILIANSIKYLLAIRNRLTSEQLYSMLQLLIIHLGSEDQLIYTYATTAIERILTTTLNHRSIFDSMNIHLFLEKLLARLFYITFKNSSAVKIAENDHIMKAIMRTIIIAGPSILPYSALLSEKLSDILKIITSNPSNPTYSHYTFEAIGACIRIVKCYPEIFLQFELTFQDIFHLIITQNIEEFIPYTLQILAQMLAFHPTQGIPNFYQNLLNSAIKPVLWQAKENTPAFARLLRSYLIKSSKFDTLFTQNSVLNSILGIFQNLISSRNSESYGFELAREIFIQIPVQILQPYFKSIANLMLSRLQKSKTNKFIYEFTLFISILLIVNKPDWNPDFVVGLFESIQKDLFLELIQHFIINTITLISEPDNRKLVIAGMICLLTQAKIATSSPLKIDWSTIFSKAMTLLKLSETMEANINSQLLQEEELIHFEIDETTFSTTFTSLATSYVPPTNPAANILDIRAHAATQMQIFNYKNPEFVRKLAFLLTKAESSALINQFQYLGINV
jgi:exportin-2 (importin alpha re-exporter)